ncbi:unnamed protein product [Trichobilharzia szidati]|nr:unnamed protein product [Trichobilharzia szidati]
MMQNVESQALSIRAQNQEWKDMARKLNSETKNDLKKGNTLQLETDIKTKRVIEQVPFLGHNDVKFSNMFHRLKYFLKIFSESSFDRK